MKKFSKLYVKYIIKTPIIYYFFLLLGAALFLILSLTIKLDVVQIVPAIIQGDVVFTHYELEIESNNLLIRCNQTDRVQKVEVMQISNITGQTRFVIANATGIEGDVQISVSIGTQTLFARIFAQAGRG